MTGFLDRLAAHLHGEAPTVALRPRGPFEPDPRPRPGDWPAADMAGPHDDADHGPRRYAASGPPLWPDPGSAGFSLVDPGQPGAGQSGSGLAGPGLTSPDAGNAGGPAAAGPLSGAGSRGAGPAAGWPRDGLAGPPSGTGSRIAGPAAGWPGDGPAGPPSDAGSQCAGLAAGRPPAGPAWPAAPDGPLAPDEGPSGSWPGPAAPAGPRSRRTPDPVAGVGTAGPLAVDGAAGVSGQPEDEGPAFAPSAAGPGGAARAAPTVILENSPPATAPAAHPGPPSLDELLARHVLPALRAAGAARSGRDTVRLAGEPVTERRAGDVHVHLGRIEVVPPAAAAQDRPARARPRPPAPDHEAYLAARRRPDRR